MVALSTTCSWFVSKTNDFFFLLKVRRKLLLIGPLAYGYCKIEDDKKWFVQSPHNNNNKNTWNLYVIKKK